MQYQIIYKLDGVYQGAIVDAPNASLAEKYFRTQQQDAHIYSTHEAQPVQTVPKDWHLTKGPLYGSPLMAETDLSLRTVRCLDQAGLHNLGELVSAPADTVKKLGTLDPVIMAEISSLLDKYGLSFESMPEGQVFYDASVRKNALNESTICALENRADGFKLADIPLGRESMMLALSRIVEFGYDGMLPAGFTPKYSAEELCRKVYGLERKPPSFISRPDFKCGFNREEGPLTPESDIRNLDLSSRLFNALNQHFHHYANPCHPPIRISQLLAFSEEDLRSQNHNRSIRHVGNDRVDELVAELAKHGMKLGSLSVDRVSAPSRERPSSQANARLSSLADLIASADARKGAPPGGGVPGVHGGPGGGNPGSGVAERSF